MLEPIVVVIGLSIVTLLGVGVAVLLSIYQDVQEIKEHTVIDFNKE